MQAEARRLPGVLLPVAGCHARRFHDRCGGSAGFTPASQFSALQTGGTSLRSSCTRIPRVGFPNYDIVYPVRDKPRPEGGKTALPAASPPRPCPFSSQIAVATAQSSGSAACRHLCNRSDHGLRRRRHGLFWICGSRPPQQSVRGKVDRDIHHVILSDTATIAPMVASRPLSYTHKAGPRALWMPHRSADRRPGI